MRRLTPEARRAPVSTRIGCCRTLFGTREAQASGAAAIRLAVAAGRGYVEWGMVGSVQSVTPLGPGRWICPLARAPGNYPRRCCRDRVPDWSNPPYPNG